LLQTISNNGLVIISLAVAAIYWQLDSLQIRDSYSRAITIILFVSYGIFTQYFINTNRRMAEEMRMLSLTDQLTGLYSRRDSSPLLSSS